MDQDSHRADICLSELLDDGLLGEGWLPTMRDAWERHLKPDAVVIPQRARVFAVLVEADWLPNYAGPYSRAVSENLDGLSSDQKPLNAAASHQHRVSLAVDSDETEPLIGAEHVVLPMHAEKLIRDQRLRVISAAVELFDFDVTRGDRIPGRDGRQRTVHLTVSATPKTTTTDDVSEIHGALVWWELELLDGICYSTEPGKEPWQDHWRPCLHLFHSSKKVKAGECVQVKVKHNDTRLFLNIVTSNDGIDNNEEADPASKRTKADNLQTTAYISPERAFQLNDDERYSIYYNAIDSALSIYRANDDDNCQSNGNIAAAVVLDVSDFSLGACIAAALGGARRIVSLEGSSGRLPMTAARVAQLGNKIASVPGQLDFEILQCYAEQLTLDLLGGTPADILLAEPYYEILEGWHLQEAMNLYYTVRMLRSNGLVSEKSIVIPSECRIMGCIIESNQIRSAYRACGDHNATTKDESICGLDHSFVNEIGSRFNEYDLSLPLWQFDYNVLSDVIELGNLAYCDPTAPPFVEPIVARAGFHTAGRCDALLVWLEYFFPASHRLATTRKTADYQQTSQPKTASEPSRSNEITTHLEPNARSVESSAVTQVRTNVLTSNNQAHRQIVHILKDTIVVGETGKAEFICTSRFGGITGLEDHQFDVRIQYLDS